jgi:surface polysaccharide O-acyltransferase-like enzyme
LVLAPTMAAAADGIVRRWVDVFWTASKTLRAMDPGQIRYVYFGTLAVLTAFGMVMLSMNEPTRLLLLAGMIYNFALAFSCFHTVFVNTVLLPKELRPGWIIRTLLVGFGTFFLLVGLLATLHDVGVI